MFIKILASGSSGNSYILKENNKLFLLDLGVSINDIKRGIKYKVADIDGAMCTHIHNDHSKSLKKIHNMGIPVFSPFETENQIQTWKKDGWYLRAFPVPHGNVSCYGTYLMSPGGHKLVYITDFQYCPYSFTKLGINTFLIACNHMDVVDEELNEGKFAHTVRDHSSLSVVKEFIRVNQTDELKNIILCHLSPENAQPEVMKGEIQKEVGENVRVEIARKGLELMLT